jgi:hypothetical protein
MLPQAVAPKLSSEHVQSMSALPPKADMDQRGRDDRTKSWSFSGLIVKRPATASPCINGLAAFCKSKNRAAISLNGAQHASLLLRRLAFAMRGHAGRGKHNVSAPPLPAALVC